MTVTVEGLVHEIIGLHQCGFRRSR